MLTRRDLVKLGLLGSGYVLLPHDDAFARVPARFRDDPTSPPTTPWMMPLPIPEVADETTPAFYPLADYAEAFRTRGTLSAVTRHHEIVAEQRWVSFHPELPQTSIWGYRPRNNPVWNYALGPTLVQRFGLDDTPQAGGLVARMYNQLPADHRGFGVTRNTMHFHGGHHPALADGFPTDIEEFPPFVIDRGDNFDRFYDHYYPSLDPGFLDFGGGQSPDRGDTAERPSSLWYHDHLLDFTAQNVYRGLVGFVIAADPLDSGNETDPAPEALRLPCGPNREYDIPLVLQDKLFNRDGSLVYNSFDHDGFIGDKFLVNGAIQPYLEVRRRKYRFRFLNGSNARIYQIFLTDDSGRRYPMTQVATEGGLLAAPIPNLASFMIAPAERVEVVVDFNNPIFNGRQQVYFENRLRQDEGRKPDKLVSRGTPLLQMRLGEPIADPSRVGRPNPVTGQLELRPFAATSQADLNRAVRRTFKFGRSHGAWTINDRLAGELDRPVARVRRGQPEIWRLVNGSGGWWHPIHIHSEFFRVLTRKGRTPPLNERDGMAKKDTILLRDNDEVEVLVKFRDHLGPFVFHCHNIEHEDMAMMARFDVVP